VEADRDRELIIATQKEERATTSRQLGGEDDRRARNTHCAVHLLRAVTRKQLLGAAGIPLDTYKSIA